MFMSQLVNVIETTIKCGTDANRTVKLNIKLSQHNSNSVNHLVIYSSIV